MTNFLISLFKCGSVKCWLLKSSSVIKRQVVKEWEDEKRKNNDTPAEELQKSPELNRKQKYSKNDLIPKSILNL